MIKVSKEPDIGERPERCFRCNALTRYWYVPKDVACCQACAEVILARDVPSKAEWFQNVHRPA